MLFKLSNGFNPLRKRSFVNLLQVVGCVLFVIWLFLDTNSSYSVANDEYPYDDDEFDETESDTIELLANPDLINNKTLDFLFEVQGREDSRGYDGHSIVYDYMFNESHVNSIIMKLDFHERCDFYFKNLFKQDINWFLDPHKDLPTDHRDIDDFDVFKDEREWKEKYVEELGLVQDPEDILSDDSEYSIFASQKYQELVARNIDIEQTMINFLSHFRIFNKCYITQDDKYERKIAKEFVDKQRLNMKHYGVFDETEKLEFNNPDKYLDTSTFESCSHLERRIYPWLSTHYPVYERFNGEISMKPPNYKDYINPKSSPHVFTNTNPKARHSRGKAGTPKSTLTNNKPCFLTQFKNKLNSKGIVMTIGNNHVADAIRLIRMLRALDNHYPIQIVYFENLSKSAKKILVAAAREPFIGVPSSYEKVRQYFPSDYVSLDGKKTTGFPKQELWFVNVHQCIHYSYRDKFFGFGNKMLAALFNSFEEYMLVDADTVPLKSPKYFFERPGYLDKGALFYRDRTTPNFRPEADGDFIKRISPSRIDQVMFNIPIITNETTSNSFFDGLGYIMESGIVLIDRNVHFNSVLTVVQLQLLPPTRDRSYGDKELFFLGFSINGDEDYHFNKYPAGGIGELTPHEYRDGDKPLKSEEICSCHPGHISEDGKTLEWLNSGFLVCGKDVDFESEFENKSRFQWMNTVEEFKAFYRSPMKITHAIIPPYKNKWETYTQNIDGEPERAWSMEVAYCHGYLWCCYSSIGGQSDWGIDNTQSGKLIEFDQKNQDFFEYYGDVWNYHIPPKVKIKA